MKPQVWFGFPRAFLDANPQKLREIYFCLEYDVKPIIIADLIDTFSDGLMLDCSRRLD